MVRLKQFINQVTGNHASVPLGRWSLEEGSVNTTDSSSIQTPSSSLCNTEYGFADCLFFSFYFFIIFLQLLNTTLC